MLPCWIFVQLRCYRCFCQCETFYLAASSCSNEQFSATLVFHVFWTSIVLTLPTPSRGFQPNFLLSIFWPMELMYHLANLLILLAPDGLFQDWVRVLMIRWKVQLEYRGRVRFYDVYASFWNVTFLFLFQNRQIKINNKSKVYSIMIRMFSFNIIVNKWTKTKEVSHS